MPLSNQRQGPTSLNQLQTRDTTPPALHGLQTGLAASIAQHLKHRHDAWHSTAWQLTAMAGKDCWISPSLMPFTKPCHHVCDGPSDNRQVLCFETQTAQDKVKQGKVAQKRPKTATASPPKGVQCTTGRGADPISKGSSTRLVPASSRVCHSFVPLKRSVCMWLSSNNSSCETQGLLPHQVDKPAGRMLLLSAGATIQGRCRHNGAAWRQRNILWANQGYNVHQCMYDTCLQRRVNNTR